MKKINEVTKKLFSIEFEKDLEDENVLEYYENLASNLIKNNKWSEVYESWYDYLVSNCKNDAEVLNFANLFWLYEGYKQFIPNAVEFCAYFYANVSFEVYPDAVDIIDSITLEVFMNSLVYPKNSLYYDEYIPTNDPMVKKFIDIWKEKRNNDKN